MSEAQKQDMFAHTAIWLWPVLWLSIRAYERWLRAYRETHGPCEVAFWLSAFGTVHVHRIYPPKREETSLTGQHISRFEQRIYAEALTPDELISQPLRKVLLERHPQPHCGLGVQRHTDPSDQTQSIRDGPSDRRCPSRVTASF